MNNKTNDKWRRDLTPAEDRVDFKRLEEEWSTMEESLVDELIDTVNHLLGRVIEDIRKILEAKDYKQLLDLRVGYKDKLVNIIRKGMIEAFDVGKRETFKEFKVKKDAVLSTEDREFMAIKTEAIVLDMQDKIKHNTIFIVLAGLKAKKSVDSILEDVKGKAYDAEE